MNFILGTAALLLGPIIYAAAGEHRLSRRLLDALIVLSIGFIIVVHIVPAALEHGGNLAILIIILGLAFPMALERLFREASDTAHLVIVAIAAVGLLTHALIDGVALLPGSGTGLAHAIVLHRLPVGMALWWAIKSNFGIKASIIVFALFILATAAGYLAGESIIEVADMRTIAMFQAFVAGSLIHVLIFGVKHHHD
jgi:hypothetical protein